MTIQQNEQATAERAQIEQDLRALKWQGIKARIQGLKPAQDTTCECGGMLFTLETGDTFCLNCGEP